MSWSNISVCLQKVLFPDRFLSRSPGECWCQAEVKKFAECVELVGLGEKFTNFLFGSFELGERRAQVGVDLGQHFGAAHELEELFQVLHDELRRARDVA